MTPQITMEVARILPDFSPGAVHGVLDHRAEVRPVLQVLALAEAVPGVGAQVQVVLRVNPRHFPPRLPHRLAVLSGGHLPGVTSKVGKWRGSRVQHPSCRVLHVSLWAVPLQSQSLWCCAIRGGGGRGIGLFNRCWPLNDGPLSPPLRPPGEACMRSWKEPHLGRLSSVSYFFSWPVQITSPLWSTCRGPGAVLRRVPIQKSLNFLFPLNLFVCQLGGGERRAEQYASSAAICMSIAPLCLSGTMQSGS